MSCAFVQNKVVPQALTATVPTSSPKLIYQRYAATNVEEDMAESFAFFALNRRSSGNSIYEQKVAFYYEFPELVEYRQQIIEGLCLYIK